jgi:3-methyladenine DNA glycosylase Tag
MMGGIDPMMMMMMVGGLGGSVERNKNSIEQRKQDKKRMRQIKARIDRASRVDRANAAQPSSRASRLTSRMSAGFRNTLGNKTPSLRGGIGLSVAGQAISSLAPGAGGLVSDLTGSQTAGDTTEAFGSATGSITQFAAAGAMIAGPLGAATGAVIGFGKALMDVSEMNKNSAKTEREAQAVSSQFVSSQLFKQHTGGQQVFDNPDTMVGRFIGGMNSRDVEAKLSALAKGTGMESLDITKQLMESKKAFESFSIEDINSKEAKEAQKVYVQNLKHATKLIKNSNKIGSAINKIKATQKLIEEELANDLSDKLSKDVDVIQGKLDTKQGLMVGRQGPFADMINRDLGLAQKSGEVTQAMSVVGKLKNQLAGAETEEQREEIDALLKEATADFTDKIKEGAIFMQQKQNEVGREILAVEKRRQDLASKRGAVNLSDITKAGTGEIFDLSIVGRFQEELKNIRSSGISGDEKDVRIAELVAEVGEAISGLNEGRQKFIKSITVQTLADSERESAARKRAIGGEEKNFEGISLKQRFMEAGFDESAVEENEKQLQALKTQQDAIAKQMKNYADAFDAESIVESVAKTNKELEKATANLAKYTEASDKIGGLSAKILTLADTAGTAIEEQTALIGKLVKSSKASETSVGALVSKETGKNEKQ